MVVNKEIVVVNKFSNKRTPPIVFVPEPVTGASHIKNNKPCQDASLCLMGKKHTFIAVSDGHGGMPYFRSEIGSRFAVQAAGECMTAPAVKTALKKSRNGTLKDRNQIILQLKKSILGRWNALVSEHFDGSPFTEAEYEGVPQKYVDRYRDGMFVEHAYGATIIAVLWTDSFMLALQIGDGSCVVADDAGTFSHPVPVDERCFLNTTTSICDEDVIDAERFRHYFSDVLPAAVLIASDGVGDCFGNEEKLYDFYRIIMTSFCEKDAEIAGAELLDYLPRLSAKGSGDDISIAMIIDPEVSGLIMQPPGIPSA